MKKALLVTRVSGFIPQHEMNNVKLLQEMGYEVHYATNLNVVVYGRDNSRLEGTGLVLHQVDFNRSPASPDTKKALFQLVQLMTEIPFDLVHCHMPLSGVLARMAAQRVRTMTGRKVPVLYTAHGFHFCKGAPWKNWAYYPVERHMARYTDRLITINEEDYRRAGTFPLRGRAERISGVGLRLERFDGYRKESWEVPCRRAVKREGGIDFRQRYGIPDDCILAVTVGELAPGKNHLAAIEAVAKTPDLKTACLICGEGAMEQTLRRRITELHLEDRVILTGYVEDIPALLQQCDVFLFPSGREGLPVALMEAMAVGLPVIASDIRGVSDLMVHAEGGYLVQGFAPEAYAGKLRRMFSDGAGGQMPRAERRRQMGLWNRERVREFSLPVVEKQMRKIYESLD